MSYWLTDPQLFLYVKGTGPNDVHLWRCKKPVSTSSSSSLVVPMKPDDFDFVKIVKTHMELIGDMFDWDESDYKKLVKYIYERLLLVNGQGLVIAEIYKLNDTNEIPIYIRSLDVLPLKSYIPHLRERPIPLRTVKYLGDVNGKAAMMEEEDSNVRSKLIARVVDLESKNKTLIAGQVAMTDKVDDLESKNKTLEAENKTLDSNVKTLEGKVTKLTADLVTQMNALTTLQQDQVKNINANTKEAWMNDLTNSEWVGIAGLQGGEIFDNFIIVGLLGTFTVDDSSTNVRATYWYKIHPFAGSLEHMAISVEDLTPNKERARFSKRYWVSFKSKGKTYAYRSC